MKIRRDPQQLRYVSVRGGEVRWYDYLIFSSVHLFIKAILPFFNSEHPWRIQPPTLRSWVYKGTYLAAQFGIIIWVCVINSLLMLYTILNSWTTP